MTLRILAPLLSGFVCLAPLVGAEAQSSVCERINKEKEPSAYLLDQHGNLSKGPIDFGRFAYKYSKRDSLIIPTTYRLIVTPARLELGSCSEG